MIKLPSILFLILLSFSGCSDKTNRANQNTTPLPEAMQESNSSYSLKRGYDDPVNSIYQNLLDKSPELNNIDDITKEVLSGKSDSTEVVLKYLNTVNNYYTSAGQHLGSIKDSVIKEKMLEILILSKNNFASQSKPFTSLVDSINGNVQRVQDRLEVLKVLLTLPIIKEYEKNNQPPLSPLKDIKWQLENRERVLDSIIKKNGG